VSLAAFQEPSAGLEGGQGGQDGQHIGDICDRCDIVDSYVGQSILTSRFINLAQLKYRVAETPFSRRLGPRQQRGGNRSAPRPEGRDESPPGRRDTAAA